MPFDKPGVGRRQFSDHVLEEAYRIVRARHHPVDLLDVEPKQVTHEIYVEVRRIDLERDTRRVPSDE